MNKEMTKEELAEQSILLELIAERNKLVDELTTLEERKRLEKILNTSIETKSLLDKKGKPTIYTANIYRPKREIVTLSEKQEYLEKVSMKYGNDRTLVSKWRTKEGLLLDKATDLFYRDITRNK